MYCLVVDIMNRMLLCIYAPVVLAIAMILHEIN